MTRRISLLFVLALFLLSITSMSAFAAKAKVNSGVDPRDMQPIPAATPVAGAEVHYRRGGQLYHRVAAAPGALSIVERDGAVTCHHTYVSRRLPDAVIRLVLRLRAVAG